jgi:hypothetical protein
MVSPQASPIDMKTEIIKGENINKNPTWSNHSIQNNQEKLLNYYGYHVLKCWLFKVILLPQTNIGFLIILHPKHIVLCAKGNECSSYNTRL